MEFDNESNKEAECDVCGGKNFHKEAGYYYCSECQTQSQNVREHMFNDPGHATKTIKKKSKRDTKDDYLTSWECYNYILLGLVNELIALGARKELKRTVQVLWLKYLRKMEVISDDPDHVPKLQAVNFKM